MTVRVQVDVVAAEQSIFLRLVRWENSARKERVSVQVCRQDGTCEGEVDVDLGDLLRAVDALMARSR